MIQIKTFTFNSFFENTYLLYDETGEALIVDAGMCYEGEDEQLFNFVEEQKLIPVKTVNTHAHIDHLLGLNSVHKKYDLQTQFHFDDIDLFDVSEPLAKLYGYPEYCSAPINRIDFLKEGDLVQFGNTVLSVLFCPGHSPGHVCFYCEKENFLVGGDVLFFESIGRTDIPFGDFDQLISGIRNKLLVLPEDCIVYPGHGKPTTIGGEKKHNPFLKK